MLRPPQAETRTPEEIERDEHHAAILSAISSGEAQLVEVGAAKKRVAAESKEFEASNVSLRKEESDLKKSIADLKIKLETSQKEYDQWVTDHETKKAEMTASLPDHAASLAELEEKKAPIQAEISRLSSIQLDSQKSLASWNEKVTAAEKEFSTLEFNIETAKASLNPVTVESIAWQVENKKGELKTLTIKVTEAENLAAGIENRREVLSTVNKDISDAEVKFASLKTEIVTAQGELKTLEDSFAKRNEDIDQKIKGLAILEQRVDSKFDIFKQYKEKFLVDELARMKINPEITG